MLKYISNWLSWQVNEEGMSGEYLGRSKKRGRRKV